MLVYITRRIMLLIPVLIVVAVLAFVMTNVMPGDPVTMILGNFALQEDIDLMREQLGLDQPFAVRFLIWGQDVLHGDLGDSIFLHEPVTTAIVNRMEPTVLLALIGQSIGILIGVPLGILAAINHRTIIDQLAIFIALLGISIPGFWLCLVCILVFSVKLGIFPAFGYESIASAGLLGALRYVTMPGVIIGFGQSAMIARMTRSAMLDVMQQDYIRTARSKGLREEVVVWQHALKNAMIPVVTVIGFSMASLLSGTWIAESIFAIPGTGNLAITAIMRRDYPIIQGSMIFVALIYVIINLLVDISYALINPRIKYE
ncbi:MAG: ABC transporter permease [Clostridiales bacterium]